MNAESLAERNVRLNFLHFRSLLLLLLGIASLTGSLIFHYQSKNEPTSLRTLLDEAVKIENFTQPEDTPPDRPVLISGVPQVTGGAIDTIGYTQGLFLALERKCEVYAWKETPVPKEKQPPPPNKTSDRYSYRQEWIENPIPWNELQVMKGHEYFMPRVGSESYRAEAVYFGRIELDLSHVTKIEGWKDLTIDANDSQFEKIPNDGKYLYNDIKAKSHPVPGDFRLSYRGIPFVKDKTWVSVLGKRDFNKIVPFLTPQGEAFLIVFIGTIDEFKASLPILPRSPYGIWSWVLGGLGFVLFGFGVYSFLRHRRKSI